MMPTRNHHIRIALIAIPLIAGMAGLGWRLYYWQRIRHADLSAVVNNNHERRIKLPARRGMIVDCNDNVLAHSIPVRTVILDPQLVRDQEARRVKTKRHSQAADLTRVLAEYLVLPQSEIRRKLEASGHYVALKHKVSEETSRQLDEALKRRRIDGVNFEDGQMRVYPNGPLMSHVLGYVNASQRGVDGVEHLMQNDLLGQDGWRRIERDRRGQEIVVYRNEDFPPRHGYTVALTLDQMIQNIVEQELDRAVQRLRPESAVAIVMRPFTGEILAMASRPAFDPNASDKQIETLKNRAVSDLNEPGSTFKVVTVAAALDQRLVTLNDRIPCENGRFLYAGRYLNDHEPYDNLTVAEVLVHSSNIGAAKIAIMLGNEKMHRAMRNFGFGEKAFGEQPGDGWPGEIRGIVHPLRNWSKLSITRVAMGHEVGVTPLQMVNAMCALANGGNLMRPQVIRRVMNQGGDVIREFFPQVRRCVVDRKAAREITEALKQVVSRKGTAARAAVPGFVVAGKTGTAQKLVNGQFAHDHFVASFSGFFPADAPEVCIYVMFDDPKGKEYSGGMVAAPVFREIAIRVAAYLNLKPSEPSSSFPPPGSDLIQAANAEVAR